MRELRVLELSFAYDRATALIESECSVIVDTNDRMDLEWYDLSSTEEDLTEEVSYLESRRLLQQHPEHPRWVMICDEGEPLPEEESCSTK